MSSEAGVQTCEGGLKQVLDDGWILLHVKALGYCVLVWAQLVTGYIICTL